MNFENGSVDSIRSITQRGLAIYWAKLAKDGLPSFDRFEPDPRLHDPKQLAVWKVEPNNAELVFRALYRGKLFDEAFNEEWTGKTLAQVTPPSSQPAIIAASAHCASTGCAIYSILRSRDGAGFPLDLERLLLPFGKDGRVQIVVASLQLISLEGTVERSKIVGNFEVYAEIVLSLRISAANFKPLRSLPSARGN